jgi:hypothetical protein
MKVVRPFINFVQGYRKQISNFLLLLNCGTAFRTINQKLDVKVPQKKEMVENIKKIKPTFIFTDDDLKRLKLAQAIKKETNVRTISYAQILYGSHIIANCFDLSTLALKEKLLFTPITKLISRPGNNV